MKLEEKVPSSQPASGATVVQKQVKQKLLQAQQEEALLVQTSTVLQSKMEKVEQQLCSSMNGYHIGHHLKYANQQQQQIKCPMQDNQAQSQTKLDNEIASAYFQAKYGPENNNTNSHRSASVGFNGHNYRSNTQTPERDVRASSQAPSNGTSQNGQSHGKHSFSYLSLLDKNGGFPHRTQPIGDLQTSRRNSAVSGSQDHLNNFAKPNLMVRSNPIGLAEPSVKRDGYAVGKLLKISMKKEKALSFSDPWDFQARMELFIEVLRTFLKARPSSRDQFRLRPTER